MTRQRRDPPVVSPDTPHRGPDGACFGCGVESSAGLHLDFHEIPGAAAGSVRARLRLGPGYAGPPGVVHGGIVATVLDEAMAKVVAHRGEIGVTQELRVRFRRPLLVDQDATVEACLVRRRGSVLHLRATATDAGGQLLAEGRARFTLLTTSALSVLTRSRPGPAGT